MANQGLPKMKPVQLGLEMPGCETPLELAWKVHRRRLPNMTLSQALERPLTGRLIRAHAATIERMQREKATRRRRR